MKLVLIRGLKGRLISNSKPLQKLHQPFPPPRPANHKIKKVKVLLPSSLVSEQPPEPTVPPSEDWTQLSDSSEPISTLRERPDDSPSPDIPTSKEPLCHNQRTPFHLRPGPRPGVRPPIPAVIPPTPRSGFIPPFGRAPLVYPHLQRPSSPAISLTDSMASDHPSGQYECNRRKLLILVRGLSRQLSKHIDGFSTSLDSGVTDPSSLTGDISAAYRRFKLELRKTAPRFRPWEENYQPGTDILRKMAAEANGNIGAQGQGTVLYVNQVMDLINKSRSRGLPGSIPFQVKEGIVRESTKEWKKLARKCSEEVKTILSNHLRRIVVTLLGADPNKELFERIMRILAAEVQKCSDSAREKIDILYAAEERIYTQNNRLYKEHRDKWTSLYTTLLRQSRGGIAQSLAQHDPQTKMRSGAWEHINAAIGAMAGLGISVQSPDLIKLLPSDPMTPSVLVMGGVMAYFEIAHKRFSDVVPQQLDLAFLRGLEESIDLALLNFVMELSVEDCSKLVHSE